MLDKILIISLIVCIFTEISQAYPDGASNLPDRKVNESSAQVAQQRHRHRTIVPIAQGYSPSDGRIIFPGDNPGTSRLTSRAPPQTPMCTDSTFCEDVQNYPRELINNALKTRRNEFKHLVRVEPPADVGQRAGAAEYETLCDNQATMSRPRAARTVNDEWLFIVNTENSEDGDVDFEQTFRVEICRNANTTCSVVNEHVTGAGYVTECKQQYMTRHALGFINDDFKTEFIVLPSSCCCHLKLTGDVYPEIGSRRSESVTSQRTSNHRHHPNKN